MLNIHQWLLLRRFWVLPACTGADLGGQVVQLEKGVAALSPWSRATRDAIDGNKTPRETQDSGPRSFFLFPSSFTFVLPSRHDFPFSPSLTESPLPCETLLAFLKARPAKQKHQRGDRSQSPTANLDSLSAPTTTTTSYATTARIFPSTVPPTKGDSTSGSQGNGG